MGTSFMDRFKQRADSIGTKTAWITLKDGKNYLRFVRQPEDEMPWRECARHFLRDYAVPDTFGKAPICLGVSCPGCYFVEELRKRGDGAKADKVKAQPRFTMAAIFRDAPNDETGQLCIKMYEMPPTVFQKLGKVLQDWEQNFLDAELGYDIEITKLPGTGGGFTQYEVAPVTKKERGTMSLVLSPLTKEELELVANAFPDLDAELVPPQIDVYEAVIASLLGEEPTPSLPGTKPTAAMTAGMRTTKTAPPVPKAVPKQEPEIMCPKFGEFDEELDDCLGCDEAEDCKAETDKKVLEAATQPLPSRTPKRTV